jgi:hypothetical protein
MLVCYCGWQVYWIAHGQIPPALFLALTGWPAPTTGGTTAVSRLLRGDWRESLAANPMALPIVALLTVTLTLLALDLLHRRRLRLPDRVFHIWILVLGVAWVVQISRAAMQP